MYSNSKPPVSSRDTALGVYYLRDVGPLETKNYIITAKKEGYQDSSQEIPVGCVSGGLDSLDIVMLKPSESLPDSSMTSEPSATITTTPLTPQQAQSPTTTKEKVGSAITNAINKMDSTRAKTNIYLGIAAVILGGLLAFLIIRRRRQGH